MPIDLGNVESIKKVVDVKYQPKSHSKLLTGTGGKVGILSEARNPAVNKDIRKNNPYYLKETRYVKGLEMNIIPLSLLRDDGTPQMDMMMPDTAKKVGTANGYDYFIHMLPHDIELRSKSDNKQYGKRVLVMYMVYVFAKPSNDTANADVKYTYDQMSFNFYNNPSCNHSYKMDYTPDPVKYFNDLVSSWSLFDKDAMEDYLQNYSLYEGTCESLEFTYDHALDYIEWIVSDSSGLRQQSLRAVLVAMEHFNFSIESYSDLYKIMENHMQPSEIDAVKETNTNLMTVAALNELKIAKPTLATFAAKPLNPNMTFSYSPLQKAAILDNDPLVLVQSGAGTGKSTVVLGRINHMIYSGVDPKDIIVLSFTNAAADHISDLYPDVRSMTIASMIHGIYSMNFTNQSLSSEQTLMNMLNATLPNSKIKQKLCNYLMKGDRMSIHDFTAMYNFVSANYAQVISMLDTVKQTTLLLEVLICAIDMTGVKIPKELQCKHMIVDEVQDNSMFEFIYMLKYTAYNHNSLFMVGDCSQTLYEFRLANPGTLNTLEASGIFQTHVLDINYRSTQAILNFANIVLANIAANRYANIQLQANDLTTVDQKTFLDTVHCEYRQLQRKKDLNDALPSMFAQQDVAKFIADALAKKEKIAILSYSRATAARCKEIMEMQFPNAKCESACSRVTYDITILSNYVARYWDGVQYFNMSNLLHSICSDMIQKYSNINASSAQDVRNRDTIQKFGAATQNNAMSWYQMYAAGMITQDEYIEKFKNALVEFEISNNAYRRRITSAINQQEKESADIANADIITSTVHSVKGLEYDHVIIIYDDESNDEASKRLYYVALTRAMKSEYILAYGTKKYSNINDWYTNLSNSLDPNFVSQNITVEISDESATA